MPRLLPVVPLLLCSASLLAAQSPRITPKGDPSVRADTIYRLAVDPAAHPEDDVAILLDDGVVRLEADGRGSRTYRSVVQILKPDAVENYSEFTFRYAPGHERFTLNWIRVVRPDGTVVSAGPAHVQDSDVPAREGNPVYTDTKVRRISLRGVEPGTIVDYSTTTEELKPFLPGDAYATWSVSMGVPVRRSRYIVDVPSGYALRTKERNLSFRRQTVTAGGRTVHTWATQDPPKIRGERFATDSNDVVMSLAVGSPLTWEELARWYARNAEGRYALTPAVREKLRDVLAGAATGEDSLRALHRWVAQDIRYVSIALGLGGYQPRPPAEVVASGFGDCKDKATLFVAAARVMGHEAYPVLLNASGGVDRDLPSLDQLDHAIAALRAPDGGYRFVDLTASLTPFGELPAAEAGEFALVVLDGGRSEVVTLPEPPVAASRIETIFEGTLDAQGRFSGRYIGRASGIFQYTLRSSFEHPVTDTTTLREAARRVARNFFPDADGDSLRLPNGRDLGTVPAMSVRILDAGATRTSGDTRLLTIPLPTMAQLAAVATTVEERLPRRFPIDVPAVSGRGVVINTMRVTLPEGVRARLPADVSVDGPFGQYVARYAQSGRELRIERRLTGATGVLPPERVDELIAYFRAVARDDAEFVVLEGPATAGR